LVHRSSSNATAGRRTLQHDQFERDRRRDGELIAAGWIVVRFTYRAITLAPGRTAERIRSVVDRWQPTAPPASL